MAFGFSIPSMGSQDDAFGLSPDMLASIRQMAAGAQPGSGAAAQPPVSAPLGLAAPATQAPAGDAPAAAPAPASGASISLPMISVDAPRQQAGSGDGQGSPAPSRPSARVPDVVAQAIGAAAQRYPDFAQAHPNYLQATARIESSFNPDAYNKSGASGLYQFMPKTAAAYGLSNPFDPSASADAATRLAMANGKTLSGLLGREPSDGELYLAHQQGAGGASKLLSNPSGSAVDTVGYKAVVQNGGTPGMTNQQFANLWINKVNGAGPGSTASPAAFGLSGPVQAGATGSRLPAGGGTMTAPVADDGNASATPPTLADAMKSLGGMTGGGQAAGKGSQKQNGGPSPMQFRTVRPRPFGFMSPMQFAGQTKGQ